MAPNTRSGLARGMGVEAWNIGPVELIRPPRVTQAGASRWPVGVAILSKNGFRCSPKRQIAFPPGGGDIHSVRAFKMSPNEPSQILPPGTAAPDFELTTSPGQTLHLHD